MIYLNQTGATKVVCTLYERCKNRVNPYFAWQLIDKDSDKVTVFCADDFSYAPYYWNAFTFSISTTMSSATHGVINVPASTYTYNVYEMQHQYDLNLKNAVGLVETGIVTINATYSAVIAYTQSNTNVTNVYRNQNRI
jgi:hypothetical protein